MGSALYKRRVRLLYVERWDSSLTFCVLPDCFVATLLAMTGGGRRVRNDGGEECAKYRATRSRRITMGDDKRVICRSTANCAFTRMVMIHYFKAKSFSMSL